MKKFYGVLFFMGLVCAIGKCSEEGCSMEEGEDGMATLTALTAVGRNSADLGTQSLKPLDVVREDRVVPQESRRECYNCTRDRDTFTFINGDRVSHTLPLSQVFCVTDDGTAASVEEVEAIGRRFNGINSCIRNGVSIFLSRHGKAKILEYEAKVFALCRTIGLISDEGTINPAYSVLAAFSPFNAYSYGRIGAWGSVSVDRDEETGQVTAIYLQTAPVMRGRRTLTPCVVTPTSPTRSPTRQGVFRFP